MTSNRELARQLGVSETAVRRAEKRGRIGRASRATRPPGGVAVTNSVITFTAPAAVVQETARFEFDVPVRFGTDHTAVTVETYRLQCGQQIPIVELRT